MPAVAARLTEELGVPTQLADPDLAVAKGAAIYGEKKSVERLVAGDLITRGQLVDGEPVSSASEADLDAACARLGEALGITPDQVRRTVEVQVLNVCSRGFGVMAVGMSGGLEAVFLVHRNDRLPVSVRRSFGTMHDDQDIVTVRVVEQGGGAESTDPHLSKIIAEASITDIPHGYPAGSQIEITLAMGFDGILELTALHEGMVNRPLKTQIETSAALSQADVARERAQVARLRHGKPK
jgi:molecular chaperone DnaK (HSP70)